MVQKAYTKKKNTWRKSPHKDKKGPIAKGGGGERLLSNPPPLRVSMN